MRILAHPLQGGTQFGQALHFDILTQRNERKVRASLSHSRRASILRPLSAKPFAFHASFPQLLTTACNLTLRLKFPTPSFLGLGHLAFAVRHTKQVT